jgi:hypothetical protein
MHEISRLSLSNHILRAQVALSTCASNRQLTAASIRPVGMLSLLIDDFFTYIHPLCPIPHESSFRESWRQNEDLCDKPFLALVASMIGAFVSSFPHKPWIHAKSRKLEHMFPDHISLVHRCQRICSLVRGPGYLEYEHLSTYDAATSYFHGLTGLNTFKWVKAGFILGSA